MNIEIANRLVRLRKEKNLSQEQLAEKVGVSRQAVSKWERAEASPDTDNLIILSKIYGMSLDEMLFSKDGSELPTAGELSVSEPRQDEGNSKREWNGASSGWEEGSAGFGYERNDANSGWEGYRANPGYEASGANPQWQRNWGAEERKKISKIMNAFPYPVFLTLLYLILGFTLHLWHPAWLLFLTIPMYYMLADSIGKV
jgi:HTH-type transcriptional regulator/antitoxin HipB